MKQRSFHYYAFASVLLWATVYNCNKIVLTTFSSFSVGTMRCVVGGLFLALVLAAKRMPRPPRKDIPWFFLTSVCGMSIYLIMFSQGAKTIGPTTSCIVISTTPVITAILARILFKERLSWVGWIAIAIAFTGIVVLSLWDGSLSINDGIIWTQSAAFLLAFYNIIQRKLSERYNALTVTAYSYIAGAITLIPFVPGAFREGRDASSFTIGVLLYMGIFSSAFAYLLYAKAITLAPKTSYAANYMFLTPLFAGILEFVWTSSPPDTGTLVGGVIILAGLVLFSLAGKEGS